MTWMKSRVRPSLRARTTSTRRRRPGRKRSSPIRSSGPLGTSRIPVASTTSTPGWPSAKRAYQSITSGVTKPSSVARHGTIAGTHVRSRTSRRPMRAGANQRARSASCREGQRTAGIFHFTAARCSRQHGEPLDLEEAAVLTVVEVAGAHEGHRGKVAPEILTVDRADRPRLPLVLADVEHVDRELHHVGEAAAGGLEHGLDVLADLPELRDEVALAHDLPGAVSRDLARDAHQAAAAGLEAVREADGPGERRRVEGATFGAHALLRVRRPACRPAPRCRRSRWDRSGGAGRRRRPPRAR